VYETKRPRQLANRDVFLKIGEPIDLGRFVSSYLDDSQATRHNVAEQLRDVIQTLVNAIVAPARRLNAGSRVRHAEDARDADRRSCLAFFSA
jgi:hypothetical protein